MKLKLAATLMFLILAVSGQSQSPFVETFPLEIAQKYADEETELASLPPELQGQLFNMNKRWTPGTSVRVAFNGGNSTLHKKIVDVANEWTKYGNLKFDFGYNSTTKTYRTWTNSDTEYHAEIRIAFDLPGYWSAIGTDSVNPRFFGANKRSMNLGGFLQPNLHHTWATTVLHEFGHALGFSHEHQHERCKHEIRWERGPNGEPSVYDVFLQWQGWSKNQVDMNLKTFVAGRGDIIAPHERESIMHYSMPPDIFINGKRSPCYVQFNQVLSLGDKAGMARGYPSGNPDKFRSVTKGQIEVLEAAREETALLAFERKSFLDGRVIAAKQSVKPRVFFFIADETQRDIANEIVEASNAEFVPLRVTNLNTKWKPDKIEVRYLRHPEDRPVAEAMLKILRDRFGITNARVSYTVRSPKAEKPGDIEVWFSRAIQRK